MGYSSTGRTRKSKLINRKCYGYVNGQNGELVIDEEQANEVRLIFKMYLSGATSIGIVKELEKRRIKSPTGNDKWTKSSIDKMLVNEKYIGNVVLLNNGNYKTAYKFEENNPSIIDSELFDVVQIMKAERSNVEITEDGVKRKGTKYSSKERRVLN